ncbi:MAG: MarR family transcriptional regulator [Oryzomonas sp.]|uniref:MarR family winged helix-turn-helix transcriptional regulator n=1 Tax=Oryzomonas sp. TaxID=2855186 RepID=UPI0028401992|nr:MarR family transcriptional regulator [Oryzomonas sp.]MDR3581278.1 MarR family transcriptional regulator [Oryzomonas sp.]
MGNNSDEISEVIDNLRRSMKAINEYSKTAEKETGLTGPQLWAIKLVAGSAPIKVSDLARRMYLHPATVVGILDRLESKGLVQRTRSTEDRRVVEIDLTAQGRVVVSQAPEVAQGMLVKGLESLSPKKLSHVSESMRDIVRILGAEDFPPQLLFSQEVNLPLEPAKKP